MRQSDAGPLCAHCALPSLHQTPALHRITPSVSRESHSFPFLIPQTTPSHFSLYPLPSSCLPLSLPPPPFPRALFLFAPCQLNSCLSRSCLSHQSTWTPQSSALCLIRMSQISTLTLQPTWLHLPLQSNNSPAASARSLSPPARIVFGMSESSTPLRPLPRGWLVSSATRPVSDSERCSCMRKVVVVFLPSQPRPQGKLHRCRLLPQTLSPHSGSASFR